MSETRTFAYLVDDSTEGERYPLSQREILLGRGTACQVQLQDPKVSREHARITIRETTTIIEDLESSHGTLVNGQRVLSAELKQGDLITLGDTGLRFEVAPDSVATMMVDEIEVDLTTTCAQCGEQVSIDQNFCPACGHALKEVPQKRPEREMAQPAPVAAPQTPAPTPQATPQAPAPAPVQPAADQVVAEPRGRRVLMFVIGLTIPLVLGLIGVVALIALGVFDEPELSLPLDDESSIIASPTSDEGLAEEQDANDEVAQATTIEPGPPQMEDPYLVRAFLGASDVALPVQSELADYDDLPGDAQYLYVIPVSVGQEFVIDYFYCGTSETILDEISNSISVYFEIDDVSIPDELLSVDKTIMETRACMIMRGVFQGLTPGEYSLQQTMNVTDQIYDGWETWGPEELVSKILIRVGDNGS